MPAADLAPLGSQQASQHPRAGEWELQVQLIEAPHDREVGGRHGARQIINAAAADLQNVRLLGDRQIVLAVDHRFALSNPALVSAPSNQLPDLGMQRLYIDRGRDRRWAPRAEHVGSPALKLGFPGGDLIGVDVEMLGQLGQCPVAWMAASATFALKAGE